MTVLAAITSGRWKENTARECRPKSASGASGRAGTRGFQASSKPIQAAKLSSRNGPSVHLSIQRNQSGLIDKNPCCASKPASTMEAQTTATPDRHWPVSNGRRKDVSPNASPLTQTSCQAGRLKYPQRKGRNRQGSPM